MYILFFLWNSSTQRVFGNINNNSAYSPVRWPKWRIRRKYPVGIFVIFCTRGSILFRCHTKVVFVIIRQLIDLLREGPWSSRNVIYVYMVYKGDGICIKINCKYIIRQFGNLSFPFNFFFPPTTRVNISEHFNIILSYI